MALNAALALILDATGLVTVAPSIPVVTGELGQGAAIRGIGVGTELTGAEHRVVLQIDRNDSVGGTTAGSFAVWGANASDANAGKSVGNAFTVAPSETAASFQAYPLTNGTASPLVGQANLNTLIPFVTFANNNWAVVKNGVPLAQGAGAGKFTVSNNAGNARIILGTNVAAYDDYAVYFLVPVQLLADGAHNIERVGVFSKTFVWTTWSIDQLATNRTLVTLNAATGA